MKLSLKTPILAAIVSVATAVSAPAVFITGEVLFFGAGTLDEVPGTATSIEFDNPVPAVLGTVDFASLAFPLDTTFTDFTFGAPGTLGANNVVDLVTVGDFQFELTSIDINQIPGIQRNIEGVGILTAPGFQPTSAAFTLSTSGTSTDVSFSSSIIATGQAVPDGGSTVAFLGLALLGLPVLSKKFSKK